MWKLIKILFIGILFNCSYYSFYFTAWLSGPNTKMMLATLGLVWFFFDSWRQNKGLPFTALMLGGATFSAVYSIINLVSVDINGTDDYSYANYLTSFFTWVFSMYPAMAMLRLEYGKVTFTRVAYYLAGVSVFQCISALLIDNVPAFEAFADSIAYFATDFFDDINRLRCFSTALDPAGVRFALVLVLITGCLCVDEDLKKKTPNVAYLVISFFIILAIGSMVARTTFVGAVVGVVIYILHSPLFSGSLKRSRGKVALIFTSITALAVGVFIYLYNTDPYYYHLLRFAFEGFFNFVERGEFTTSSTEVLQTMWKWPTDTQGWIIGTGIYGQFSQGTDIGYCRLILYSGLIGFVTFALSFVFYAYILGKKYYPYRWMFLGFLAMTFIIWVKVSSDILMIYTFMFWLRPEDDALILQQAKA